MDQPKTPERPQPLLATPAVGEDDLHMAAADLMLRIQEAQQSPLGLYKLISTDEQGRPIIIKRFHKEWNQLFLHERLFIICASRELTKTSMLLAAAAWFIGANPNVRIRWLSADADTAIKRLAVIHSILDSPIFQLVFPNVRKLTAAESRDEKRPNSATVLNVRRDFRSPEPTVQASGILTSGTGGRCDCLICDDVVSETNALLNPTLRPKVISKFLSDWLATLVASGKVWYVGSPWHKDDLLAYLKRADQWKYREYKHGKPGNPYFSIFPERWPEERLKERRLHFGPQHYARAYLCQPFSDDTVAIKPTSLKRYTAAHLTEEKLYNQTTAVISMDPSSGKQLQKGKLDYTGVTVFLIWQNRQVDGDGDLTDTPIDPLEPAPFQIYVPLSYQVKLPHVYQAKLAWQLARQWDARHLVIEAEGMQNLHSWLEKERQEDPTLPLVEIHPSLSRNLNKGQRLVRISPLIEVPADAATLVRFSPAALEMHPQPYFLAVGDAQYEALNDLYHQITDFPTQHDDILDSFTGGLHWCHANIIGLPGGAPGEESGTGAKSISCIAI